MTRAPLFLALALSVSLSLPVGAAAQTSQPPLPTEKLVIVTKQGKRLDFDVEMALTPQQQETGLMGRTTVAPAGGMLFDWGRAQESTMWMKNTVSPLDMVFINPDGTVRRVVENTVPQSLAVIDSRGPVRATLELAAGTARRLDIHAGDKVEQRIFGDAK